jgi:hypothetical protein
VPLQKDVKTSNNSERKVIKNIANVKKSTIVKDRVVIKQL